jgi:hypothetical protein
MTTVEFNNAGHIIISANIGKKKKNQYRDAVFLLVGCLMQLCKFLFIPFLLFCCSFVVIMLRA